MSSNIEKKMSVYEFLPDSIKRNFTQMRKLGNNFYLAFSFHYLEILINNKNVKLLE